MRIAIATCLTLPEPDVDAPLLDAALRAAGMTPSLLAWDAPADAAAFAEHDLVVIRSTWNYYTDVEGFRVWAEAVGSRTKLLNPASVVRWNTDKTYLGEIEARGVPIVPTAFVGRGERRDVAALAAERGWSSLVVKPVVSAGSWRTARFEAGQHADAQAFLDALTADRGAMVQAFMPSVDTYGERSLVWIDGEVTHAIRKSPRLSGDAESVSGTMPIADDERAFAERVLARSAPAPGMPHELLYARVDVVRDDAGALCLMELELVEPSLFFLQAPAALEPFVRAIARHAR